MNILDDLKLQYRLGGTVQRLIYWNIGCFLILLIFGLFSFNLISWVALSTEPNEFAFKPWTFISYSFFHEGFWHLLFNMIVLNFSGTLFLTFFTQKQFLGVYLLGALFAGIIFVLSYYLMNINAVIVGASAAIMAVLFAVTVYQPFMYVRLLLIGNVKLWHISAALLILDLMQIRSDNMGGHISHLSGAFFGFIFVQLLKSGTDLSQIVTRLIDFGANMFKKSPSTPFKKVHRNYSKPIEKRTSRIVTKDRTQQQIDEILDKISKSGYDSLTKEEKDFLFKAGK